MVHHVLGGRAGGGDGDGHYVEGRVDAEAVVGHPQLEDPEDHGVVVGHDGTHCGILADLCRGEKRKLKNEPSVREYAN